MSKQLWATVGPASFNQKMISEMTSEGVDLFRINLSHTPLDAVEEWVTILQSWTDVPLCLDSEGAQIRNETMTGGAVDFEEDARVEIHFEPVRGDSSRISFTPAGIARQFRPGDRVHIDFDHVCLEVEAVGEKSCTARVVVGGNVGSNKATDVERSLKMPAITEKDRAAIAIGRKHGVKHFALSFASTRKDILEMRELAGGDAIIISKIESPEGVINLHEILEYTDTILIDRGDLSRRVEIEKIPFLQRRIIAAARARETPVFVATNLLETMIQSRAPTRAEVNDVVSTLQMGANGLVLAAETAVGNHPAEAVRMIRKLIRQLERWTPEMSISEIISG